MWRCIRVVMQVSDDDPEIVTELMLGLKTMMLGMNTERDAGAKRMLGMWK